MSTLPKTTALDLDLDGGWLTIWFNRPENRNALSSEITGDLHQVLTAVRNDRSIRGITLRGRGGVFCAGGDLKSFKAMTSGGATREDILALSRHGADLMALVNGMPQVTVVLIEGAAMAGGFGIACCCDVVICEASARFAMTETMIGLSPAQIAPYVIQKLGYATGRRLMLTAGRFDGAEAGQLGFADFVGTGAESLEVIEARIKKDVLKCAPGAIADTKALILAMPELDRTERIEAAANNFADRMLSDEGKEGIASFNEKRKPVWAERSASKETTQDG
ncbi:MAG: enoyl-CoA hydratase/isomerase family protein [Nitratireductor sp.]|nr:enoyl-CoA hydratase/isomerase family protein [Nitratireductor sp.]